MRLLFFYLNIILILILPNYLLFSQQIATPIQPEIGPAQQEIGLIVGLGSNIQSGIFKTECPCDFDNGKRFGYLFGIFYENDITRHIQWGISGIYDNKGVTASYLEREATPVISQTTGKTENVRLLWRHKAEADFSFITAMPFIKWMPANFFFIKLGIGASYIVGNNVKHSKELLENTVLLSTGELVKVEVPNSNNNNLVVQDSKFPQINSFQLSIDPIIGFNIPFNNYFYISPAFHYSFPLNTIINDGDFKISSLHFWVEFKVPIRLRK